MLSQAITVQLRLPGLVVWGVEEREDAIEVIAQYATTEAACPRRGRPAWQVHQVHRQRKRDARLWRKPVWILLWKRRFRCRVCRYVFMEPDPACGARRRTTCRLRSTVAHQAEEATVRTVSRWHGVSEGLVQRSWLEAHLTPPAQPRPHVYIGLDGFCVRRPGAMWRDSGTSRRGIRLPSWPENACATSSRCSSATRRGRPCGPWPSTWRRRTGRRWSSCCRTRRWSRTSSTSSRWRGGRCRRCTARRAGAAMSPGCCSAALSGYAPRSSSGWRRPLQGDRVLRVAWALKEELRAVYRAPMQAAADRALSAWIRDAEASDLRPFVRTARTLRRWRTEILNYWRHPITNAVVEGKHNRVKVLKRRAYGFRNNRTFQFRILNLIHTD